MATKPHGPRQRTLAIDDGYRGRFCTRFYCDEVGERRCCADCWRKAQLKCNNFCLNHPDRCLLEDVDKRPQEGNCDP